MEIGMGDNRSDNRAVFRTLTLVSQVGITMIMSIGMMTAAGIWLDSKYKTGIWTLLFFALGSIAGGKAAIKMIRRANAERKSDRKETEIFHEIYEDSQKHK